MPLCCIGNNPVSSLLFLERMSSQSKGNTPAGDVPLCNCFLCPVGTTLKQHFGSKLVETEKELLKRYQIVSEQLRDHQLFPYEEGKASSYTTYLLSVLNQDVPRHHSSLLKRFFTLRKQLDRMWFDPSASDEEHSASDFSDSESTASQ